MKIRVIFLSLLFSVSLTSCGDKPVYNELKSEKDVAQTYSTTDKVMDEQSSKEDVVKTDSKIDKITDEQAISAIKRYCYINNPDLENFVNAREYPIYWNILSSDENEIVVLFRSYTGAQIRYYIDPVSGDTYVTELVPAIMEEEQKTDEVLNVRNYLD